VTDLARASLEHSGGAMTTVSRPGALDAIGSLAASLLAGGSVVLLVDGVPKSVGGADVDAIVEARLASRYELRRVVVQAGAHGVVLDEATIDATVAEASGAELLVSIGSGTVTDLVKVVGQRLGVPILAVQTAASVNGFADSLSVLVQRGAKRTSPSAWPSALVIDHDVLAEAPERLARAGVGDAVAVWTSPADWYLACALGVDPGPYTDAWAAPVREAVARMTAPDADDAQRMVGLVDALTLGGLMIGAAGSTAPLSGCEHLLSHVLDMRAMAEGVDHDLHGAQVGVASVVAAALWDVALHEERILDVAIEDLEPPADLRDRVLATWEPVDPTGALGEECWSAVERKVERWRMQRDGVAAFLADRGTHAAELERIAGDPASCAAALAAWEAPATFSALSPAVDADRARWALRALPFMRDRMTLADLLLFAGRWDDALVERVLARAGESGGGL
jgi:glycerol-1-phosphate dehydrogenase [NAD(P)+]